MHLRLLLLGVLILTVAASAQESVPANPQEISTQSQMLNLQPSATSSGGSGLFKLQTVPCNPMGTLAISGQGFVVRHKVWDIGYETVATGMLSLTYSLTSNMELYFSGSYFVGAHAIGPNFTFTDARQGIGSQEVGFKYRFPTNRTGLLQIGGTAGFILGTSESKITGFNFFNTRRDSDVRLRLIQSLRFQDKFGVPNLHINEGYLTQYGALVDLFDFGLGLDYLIKHHLQLSAEFEALIEQRTPIYLNENYLALTTGMRYYASPNVAFNLGANFGLSKDRRMDTSWRRTDPWQIFVGVTFTPKVNSADRDFDGIPDWLDAEINLPGYPTYAAMPGSGVMDTDGDGVPDSIDKEPSSMRGAVVDANGVALDDDHDGVPNGLDRETRTPEGAWVDPFGVAYDSDRDGVPDGLDQEPRTPYGALVDASGVALDSDGDGIPDGIDLEENTPQGAIVDAWGRSIPAAPAPQAQAAAVQKGLETILLGLPNVHFDFAKADVKPEDYSALDVVGQAMTHNPEVVILIEGHADSIGTQDRNMELSYKRARAIRDYLLAKFPTLSRANFTITGLGENDPIADNGTDAGRIQNRRAEFKILNRKAIQEMITTWE